jgi:FAD/FMN-containing dehydrogenase
MCSTNQTRRRFTQQLLALVALGSTGILSCSRVVKQALTHSLENVKGRIFNRADDNYYIWWASLTWYVFKPKRFPDTIVRAESEPDVIETINYARENGLKIAVRSTGHNPAKSVVREGGVLLDTGLLRDVEVDAANRTAWIQPGIRAEELLSLTMQHGLVFPAAHTGIVGLGGYLLGGGLGWNMPEYGIACRSVLAAEIIMANGEKVLASADQNRDLHWAIRGVGPGFFGAVTRYQLKLYPIHKALKVNFYVIPIEKINETIAEFRKIGELCDKRLEILVKVGHFHPASKPYAERELVCTVGFFAFGDSEGDSAELLSPVENSRIADLSIIKRESTPISYDDLYRPPETDHSSPSRTAVENIWTEDPGQCLLLLTEKMIAEPTPSPRSFLLSGWSLNTTFRDESSCVRTDARHYVSWYMIADKEEDIDPNYKWMDESVEIMRPFSRGHYINEIDPVRYPHHVQECFSADDWERLETLRNKYDPDGVFHTYVGTA